MTLVLWSGGCDSTLAMWFEARFGDNSVRSVSIIHPQVGAPLENKRARDALLPRFAKLGVRINGVVISFGVVGDFEIESSGLPQPGIWLPTAMSYLRKDEDLVVGYIAGDDIWHHKTDLETAFYSIQKLCDRTGKLRFPLEHLGKSNIIKELRAIGLYKDCWYCEAPLIKDGASYRPSAHSEVGVACGYCHSCVRHMLAIWQINLDIGNDDGGIHKAKQRRGQRQRPMRPRRQPKLGKLPDSSQYKIKPIPSSQSVDTATAADIKDKEGL